MSACHGVADRKTQSAALPVGREEGVEEAPLQARRKTRSIVAYRQLNLIIGGRRGTDDHPGRVARGTRGESIEAVAEEIEDYLLNLSAVNQYLGQLRRQLQRQLHSMQTRIGLQQVLQLLHEQVDARGQVLAALSVRQFSQPSDDVRGARGLQRDLVQRFTHFAQVGTGSRQQPVACVRIVCDRGQRLVEL